MQLKRIDFEHNGRTYRRKFGEDGPVWFEKTDDYDYLQVANFRMASILEQKMQKEIEDFGSN